MPSSRARRTAARRSLSAVATPHPVPPTAQAPNPRRGPDVKKRSGGPTSVGAPGRICSAPLGVAGGHQLRRLDDLGTMTAGHELLHLDDLHTSSFARIHQEDGYCGNPTGCRHTRQPVILQPCMILIHTLLTENALADEFVSAFHERRLPEKFFYWFPLSVRAWLALCSDGAYRNFVRSRSLIASSGAQLARLFPVAPLEVVSLGAGQGDKDLLLLEALRVRGARVSYVPVDTSQALLEMACAGALAAGFPAQGIKADFTNPDHLKALAAEPETPPRLVLLIGNTLGAFDPIAEARELARLLRPGDALLVDGELYAGEATVAGYDNPLNRRFAWAPLNAVGIRDADGELVFEAADDPRLPGLHLIPKHFRAGRDVEALLGGEALRLARGDRLAMNHSYKYAADTFLRILSEAGLAPRWQGRSDDQRFLMVLVSPA